MFKGISEKELVDFTTQLAVLTDSKIGLPEALELIGSQTSSKKMKPIVKKMLAALRKGKSLSDALGMFPDTFDESYIQLVRVGEESGILPQLLKRLASYQKQRYELSRKLKMAFLYPGMILLVAVAAISFVMIFIVPAFAELYADFGSELPLLTRYIIGISDWLGRWAIWMVIFLVPSFMFASSYLKNNALLMSKLESIALRLPGLGGIYLKGRLAQLFRSIGTMLENGVQLDDAVGLHYKRHGLSFTNTLSAAMQHKIRTGKKLSSAFRNNKHIPEMVVSLIYVGETTATLDRIFLQLANFYDTELEQTAEALISIIEPLLIVILGIIIGLVLIAIYLPLFDLSQMTGL